MSLLILKRFADAIVTYETIAAADFPQIRPSFNTKTLLLSDCFDRVYGISTSGVITVVLSKLRMTIP